MVGFKIIDAIGWTVSSQNSYVTVFVFGDRIFEESIKFKWGQKGRALSDTREVAVFLLCEETARKPVSIYKPERELSPETDPDGPWFYT